MTAPTPVDPPSVDEITRKLAEPFDPSEVKFKPAAVSGNRALALAYVDARTIQDRLDDVLGVAGWQDNYESLPDGSVVCELQLKLGGEWITKVDVGGPSEQPDEGDRRKAAFSDALKRAAVKFGIGRHLYRLPQQWVDYDPHKRQFLRKPVLPGTPPRPAPAKAPATAGATPGPATGPELPGWLRKLDELCLRDGLRAVGPDAIAATAKAGLSRGPLKDWSREAVEHCWAAALRLKDDLKAAKAAAARQPGDDGDDAELATDAELAAVRALMPGAAGGRGRTWRDCMTYINMPAETRAEDLTRRQCRILKAGLEQEQAPQPAR